MGDAVATGGWDSLVKVSRDGILLCCSVFALFVCLSVSVFLLCVSPLLYAVRDCDCDMALTCLALGV